MTQPEETPVSFIPSNFIEKGKILNGTFDIRNAIESIVLSLAIGIPVFHLPLSLTARIIILCMTALPAAMVALIGIGGESITAFLMNALRFVVNRRVIWRSDSLPEGKPRRKPRFKEPKTKKHRKAEKMAEPSKVMASAPPQSEPDAPAPPKSKKKEHRQFDTSTKRGIKKQAKEDIRYLKWEQKEASRQWDHLSDIQPGQSICQLVIPMDRHTALPGLFDNLICQNSFSAGYHPRRLIGRIIFQGDRLFYFLFLVIHSFCSLSGFAYPIHSLRYVLTSNAYCATGTLPPALRMGAIACAVC